MFLVSVNPAQFAGVQDDNVRWLDLSYNDALTRQLYDNFTAIWGKDGFKQANKHLSMGLMVGVTNGFDFRFGSSSKAIRLDKKVYWLREFHRKSSFDEITSHWVRVYFEPNADKKYPKALDTSEKWGSGFDIV